MANVRILYIESDGPFLQNDVLRLLQSLAMGSERSGTSLNAVDESQAELPAATPSSSRKRGSPAKDQPGDR